MTKRGRPRHPDVLTPREWEVLSLIRDGLTNELIAERIGVTIHAARYHVSQILSKLGVTTRDEAAAWQSESERAGGRWLRALQVGLALSAAAVIVALGVLAWGVLRGSDSDARSGAIATVATTSNGTGVATATLIPSPSFVSGGGELPLHGSNVRTMGLVLNFGWLLNENGLYTTKCPFLSAAGSCYWRNLTPPDVAVDHIRAVDFEDSADGWIVVSGDTDASNATQLLVYRTSDGGQSWQSSQMGEPDLVNTWAGPNGGASIDFIDLSIGWAVVRGVPGIQSDEGDLYRTDDGGQTWTKLSAPSGDPAFFEDANHGWIAGRGFLPNPYSTNDGGATWTGGPLPSDWPHMPPMNQYVPAPVKTDDGRLLVAQTGTTADSSTLNVLESTDDGGTWNTIATGSVRSEHGLLIPHILPDGGVVAFSSDGAARLSMAPGARVFEQSPVTDLATAYALDFLDSQHGWALVGKTNCISPTVCDTFNEIEQTEDGGLTWSEIAGPPSSPTPSAMP